jgi:hypothetical protein
MTSARLRWLRLDPEGYVPSAYTQLADAMRKHGHVEESKTVLAASQRVRWSRRSGVRAIPERIWSAFLRVAVGYGYKPWRAAVWLAAVVVAGTIAVQALPRSSFVESAGAPPFNSFLYTLDSLLPFVDLGYNKWVPHAAAHIVTSTLVLVGWLLATALVAAIAGVLRRGD